MAEIAGRAGVNPRRGGSTSSTTVATAAELVTLHNSLCPQVSMYVDCSNIRVVTGYYDTTWAGFSHPADGYVEYNTKYLGISSASWSNVISHEIGGHMDTWAELVSKVGTARAWTDYYDIDTYAQPYFETKLGVSLTKSAAKEVYLDCQGAVRNGYIGGYLYNYYGRTSLAAQQDACKGYRTVFDQAISS